MTKNKETASINVRLRIVLLKLNTHSSTEKSIRNGTEYSLIVRNPPAVTIIHSML